MVTYPSDWEFRNVGEICHISTGTGDTKDAVPNGLFPFFVRSKKVERINDFEFEGEAVLTAGDGVGTGKVFHYVDGRFKAHQRVYVLNNFQNFDTRFFYYYFSSAFLDEVEKYTAKSSVDSVRRPMIANMRIPRPRLPEQRAIAEVLSGFDEHLANLDELITKKKAVRDGALETLASGRQRLSGFTGYWRDTTLGAIATLNPVTPLPDTFTYVDLESVQGTEMVTSRSVDKISAPSRAQRLASSGDIFYQTVRPYQRNNYLFKSSAKDVVFSTGYAQIRTQEVPEFLFAAVQQSQFTDQVLERCTGTSYPAITPTALKEVSVRLPKSHSEQRAIAEVLFGMDDEIRLLAEERAKVEQLKLGAMDDLLTGRVRLTLGKEAA